MLGSHGMPVVAVVLVVTQQAPSQRMAVVLVITKQAPMHGMAAALVVTQAPSQRVAAALMVTQQAPRQMLPTLSVVAYYSQSGNMKRGAHGSGSLTTSPRQPHAKRRISLTASASQTNVSMSSTSRGES